MSISLEFLSKFQQKLSSNKQNKETYGEVFTSFTLINQMLDLLPESIFSNPNLKWLDPCAGTGYFMMKVYQRLMTGLSTEIKALKKRHHHIITKQLYMVEINKDHLPELFRVFGENSNILMGNYLNFNNLQFDIVVGNPPFNIGGLIKVPTNNISAKKNDGKTIWGKFVIHSLNNLKLGGYLCFITPSIWLKRDHKMYQYITNHTNNISIRCLTNTETNQIFNGEAQTPTCYFSLKKSDSVLKSLNLYDKINNKFINYSYKQGISIPLCYPSIIKKLLPYLASAGCINVIKTSMRPGYKGLKISKTVSEKTPFYNIKTCILNKLKPKLEINYSNIPCAYQGIPKLVLAHKMYGFPYYDENGYFGISNRDNYVIINKTKEDFKKLQLFLSSKLVRLVFNTTRYRMKYLERYAFEFLPDITKISEFPDNISDESINDYFNFNEMERFAINNENKKQYLSFI